MVRLGLILGGARSGKSEFAEDLARRAEAGSAKIYLATARTNWRGARDAEFEDRIAEHRRRRGPDWRTIEAPDALADAIGQADGPESVLLIDCLTLWLSNRLLASGSDSPESAATDLGPAMDSLVEALEAVVGRAIVVSNEVGLGLVPETPLGRRFRDAQGRLNRLVAQKASLVVFVAAGLPMTLKGDLREWDMEG